jgi:hypothetical protein
MACFSLVDDNNKMNIISQMNVFSAEDKQDMYLQQITET